MACSGKLELGTGLIPRSDRHFECVDFGTTAEQLLGHFEFLDGAGVEVFEADGKGFDYSPRVSIGSRGGREMGRTDLSSGSSGTTTTSSERALVRVRVHLESSSCVPKWRRSALRLETSRESLRSSSTSKELGS
jgi:hypothetical protein